MSQKCQTTIYSEGMLKKKGNIVKNWKERNFILFGEVIEYYKLGEKSPKGKISLDGLTCEKSTSIRNGFELKTPKRVYYLEADSELELLKWLQAIRERIYFLLRGVDNTELIKIRRKTRSDTFAITKPRPEIVIGSPPVRETQPTNFFSSVGTIELPKRPLSARLVPYIDDKQTIDGESNLDAPIVKEKVKMSGKVETLSAVSQKLKQKKLDDQKKIDEKKPLKLEKSESWIKRRHEGSKSQEVIPQTPLISVKPDDIDRRYTGYHVNFLSILTVPSMRQAFLDYLATESNTEPMEFLIELEKFNCDSIFAISDEDCDHFHEMCNVYLKESGKKELNISGELRRKILRVHDQNIGEWSENETPLDSLEMVRSVVLGDLKSDVFPRFLQSDIGYKAVSKNCECENAKVISLDPTCSILYKLEKYTYGTQFVEIHKEISKMYSKMFGKETVFLDYYLIKEWGTIMSFESEIDQNSLFSKREEGDSSIQDDLTVYITLIERENRRKHFRKFGFTKILSPLLSNMKKEYSEKLEYIPGLIIGDWLFYFDEYELCIPKRILPECDLLNGAVQVSMVKNGDDLRKNLAKIATNWNVNMKYSATRVSDKYTGNSVDFIDDLCKSVDLSLLLSPPWENYIQKLREKGRSELALVFTPEFAKAFKLKNEVVFNSHSDLDRFVSKCLEDEPLFPQKFSKEYDYLAVLDRVFTDRYTFISLEVEKLKDDPDSSSLKEEIEQQNLSAPLKVDNIVSCCFSGSHRKSRGDVIV